MTLAYLDGGADPAGLQEHGDDDLIGSLDKARPLAAMAVSLANALDQRRAGEITAVMLDDLSSAIGRELTRRNGC